MPASNGIGATVMPPSFRKSAERTRPLPDALSRVELAAGKVGQLGCVRADQRSGDRATTGSIGSVMEAPPLEGSSVLPR